MKTIAVDISQSVFNNDTEAMLYVTEDTQGEPNKYVFAIPVITFAWGAINEEELECFFPWGLFKDKDKEEKLLSEMKVALKNFTRSL